MSTVPIPENVFDVVVIGGGPAGLTAGLYAARADMKTLCIEGGSTVSQIAVTDLVENYPGIEEIGGSELVDRIILVQDGFDPVDKSTPMKRQAYMLNLVLQVCDTPLAFDSFEELQPYYTRLINALRQMNYQPFESADFKKYESDLEGILEERRDN